MLTMVRCRKGSLNKAVNRVQFLSSSLVLVPRLFASVLRIPSRALTHTLEHFSDISSQTVSVYIKEFISFDISGGKKSAGSYMPLHLSRLL